MRLDSLAWGPLRGESVVTASSAARGKAKSMKVQAAPSWLWIVGALVVATALIAAWFPFSALGSQRSAQASASAQLSKLRAETQALQGEKAKLKSPSELSKVAREQYQLVAPGDRVVQVLPPTANQPSLSTGKQAFAGDPGLRPPVAPSAAGLITDGESAAAAGLGHPNTQQPAHHGQGFFDRVLSTLEFWK